MVASGKLSSGDIKWFGCSREVGCFSEGLLIDDTILTVGLYWPALQSALVSWLQV